MTVHSTNPPVAAKSGRGLRTEFAVYFAIIFLAAIPLACLAWVLAALRKGSLAHTNPIRRAWSQARIIAPMIFSA